MSDASEKFKSIIETLEKIEEDGNWIEAEDMEEKLLYALEIIGAVWEIKNEADKEITKFLRKYGENPCYKEYFTPEVSALD